MTAGPLLAAAPILTILVLMVGAGWSAARAGSAGLAVALLLALGAFGYGTETAAEAGPLLATAGALGEALFVALGILWIVLPALAIHELQVRSGAIDVLRAAIGRLTGDPRVLALLVGWFFALFLEGAAGFGTAVALSAPILVSAGFRPVQAVTLAMFGHAAGVSFGAVGTPVLPQVALSGFRGVEISAATAPYHLILAPLLALATMRVAGGAAPERPASRRSAWGWALLAALLFLVPYGLLARFVGPELPTLGGALVGGLAFVALLARRTRDDPAVPDAPPAPPAALVRAGAPYLVLVVLVLLTRLVPPLAEALRAPTLGWRALGRFEGSIQILYHPGTMLLAALVLGALLRRTPAREIGGALAAAGRQLGGVAVALVAMLGLSRLMVHAGMIEVLAASAADAAGPAWPLFAPLVGVLGTFVTGSATASNILFTEFQLAAARGVGLDALPLVGAQGVGAAVGNIVCPHNIVAAGATVRLAGREGAVLARTAGVALGYALLGGVLAWRVFA